MQGVFMYLSYARTADPIASQAFSGSFKDLQEATGPKQ